MKPRYRSRKNDNGEEKMQDSRKKERKHALDQEKDDNKKMQDSRKKKENTLSTNKTLKKKELFSFFLKFFF